MSDLIDHETLENMTPEERERFKESIDELIAALSDEAVGEYERGETMSLRDFAKAEGITLDDDE